MSSLFLYQFYTSNTWVLNQLFLCSRSNFLTLYQFLIVNLLQVLTDVIGSHFSFSVPYPFYCTFFSSTSTPLITGIILLLHYIRNIHIYGYINIWISFLSSLNSFLYNIHLWKSIFFCSSTQCIRSCSGLQALGAQLVNDPVWGTCSSSLARQYCQL